MGLPTLPQSWGNNHITELEEYRATEIRDWESVVVQEISALLCRDVMIFSTWKAHLLFPEDCLSVLLQQ